MKVIHLLMALLPVISIAQNKVGINTTTPLFDLDVRGTDDGADGGELQLATPSLTNYLRFFGGRLGDPHPFIAFNDNDHLHFVTSAPDWSTYTRRMTIAPNGNIGIGADQPLSKLEIVAQGDSAELLRFTTDRPWVFKQTLTGINTNLTLQSTINDKAFEILSSNGTNRAARFFTNNTYSKVLLVPEGGEVGIGIAEAAAKLHVRGNGTTSDPQLRLTESSVNDFARIKFENENEPGIFWDIAARADSSADESRLNFYYANPGFTGDKMTIMGNGKVLVNKAFEAGGKIKVGNDTDAPQAGMIRWNASTQDFEGYTGTAWISFTQSNTSGDWGHQISYESTQDTASNGGSGDFLGNSVAISGDYAISGAPFHSINSNEVGRAYIFLRNGDTWIQQAMLSASDGADGDEFGWSVSISGQYAIVGAHRHNSNRGKAYIFVRNGTTWSQQTMLTAFDGTVGAEFGRSVAISGDYAIVGAHWQNGTQGKAYIFKRDGTTWSLQTSFIGSDTGAQDEFGWSVALAGDYAIVGAHEHDWNGNTDRGKAYVFKRNGTTWPQEAILTGSNGNTGDQFGYSVAISSTHAIVGAPLHNTGGISNTGKAYIFVRNGTTWQEQAVPTVSDLNPEDEFGYSTAIANNYACVSTWEHDSGGISDRGKAYLFKHLDGNWTLQSILLASDGAINHAFGRSTSMSGNDLIIGARGYNGGKGKIYFFNKN